MFAAERRSAAGDPVKIARGKASFVNPCSCRCQPSRPPPPTHPAGRHFWHLRHPDACGFSTGNGIRGRVNHRGVHQVLALLVLRPRGVGSGESKGGFGDGGNGTVTGSGGQGSERGPDHHFLERIFFFHPRTPRSHSSFVSLVREEKGESVFTLFLPLSAFFTSRFEEHGSYCGLTITQMVVKITTSPDAEVIYLSYLIASAPLRQLKTIHPEGMKKVPAPHPPPRGPRCAPPSACVSS